jgi:hypothetical protein
VFPSPPITIVPEMTWFGEAFLAGNVYELYLIGGKHMPVGRPSLAALSGGHGGRPYQRILQDISGSYMRI